MREHHKSDRISIGHLQRKEGVDVNYNMPIFGFAAYILS